MHILNVSRKVWTSLGLGICLGAGVGFNGHSAVTNQPIALTGQPAPGGGSGETFLSFPVTPFGPSSVVNASGDVAFVSVVTNSSGGSLEVLFLHRNGVLERLAQQGAGVPGQQNLSFGEMRSLAINDSGEVMFYNVVNFDPSSLLSNVGGTWRLLARTGTQAPGLPGGTVFNSVASVLTGNNQRFLLRSDGELGAAFGAFTRLSPSPQRQGLWLVNPSTQAPFRLLEYGGPAPDLPGGVILIDSSLALFSVALGPAPAGILAFDGQIAGLGVDPNPNPTNNKVLWAGLPADPRVVARSGQLAPPPILNRHFQGFQGLGVNGAGQLCFVADLLQLGVDQALLTGVPTNLTLVARTGDALPGGGSLRTIESTVINASGQVGFMGRADDNSLGIYLWSQATGLHLVARVGGDSPGGPEGWTFLSLGPWNLNAAGRVSFYGSAQSPDGSTSGSGWWVTDATGTPVLLAHSGTLQPADPGVLAAAGLIDGQEGFMDISGGRDGRRRFLSDFNHVVFAADLGGGQSGIYRGHIVGDDNAASEEFFLRLRSESIFARIQPAGFLDGQLTNGAFVGNSAVLQASGTKNWDGGKVSLTIVTNADPRDRLGIGPSMEGFSVASNGPTVFFDSVAIGAMTRPAANVLEVTLNSDATTAGVYQLLRSLAYGFAENLETLLQADPRHTETNRVLRLRLADAGGRIQEVVVQVEYPRTVGLALEPGAADNQWVLRVVNDFHPVVLNLQLRLSDSSRVSLKNRSGLPLGTDQWTVWSTDFSVRVDTNRPSATFNTAVSNNFSLLGTPCGFDARLYSWGINGAITWKYINDEEYFVEQCLVALFNFHLRQGKFASARGRQPADLRTSSATNSASAADFLAGPYALRAWMNQSPEGRRFTTLYEQHSPELVRIVITNSTLLNDAVGLMGEFLPGLSQFLSARGDDRVIRPDMIEQLNRVWDAFAAAGSPELQAVLAAERTRLDGFQDFVGRTFSDWGQLLAIGIPESPFIFISSLQQTNQVFSAEANRVEGLTYALERTPPVSPLNWTNVTSALIRLFDHRVELADTNAAGASFLYRLRATGTNTSP